MQETVKHVYCAEQIEIPVAFPYMLKLYAKAAIRTQPYDLLRWTSAYFRALANGQIPPVKKRLEYPPLTRPSGITPGYLKILFNQFNQTETVGIENLLARWQGVDLPESTLYQILRIGDFLDRDCPLFEFLAIGCGLLGNNLFETMVYVCELFTDEPEGGSAMIALKRFIDLYVFLASLDCSDLPLSKKSSYHEHSDEDEGHSSSDKEECPDPSKVALAGSRKQSDSSTEISTSEPDDSTASLSQCSGGENVKGTINTCRRESASSSALIEQKSARPSDASRVSNLDEKSLNELLPLSVITPEGARSSRLSSGAAATAGRASITSDSPKRTSATPRPARISISGSNTATSKNKSSGEDPGTKFEDNFDQDHTVDRINSPEVDEIAEDFEGYDDRGEAEEGIPDMESYEPIGLETLLDGICECLEPATEKPPETPAPPDPVEEFLDRMQAAFPPPWVNPLVHGIGPVVPQDQITAVCLWLTDCARRQTGLVGPRNIRHFLCPALEITPRYEESEETLFKCL